METYTKQNKVIDTGDYSISVNMQDLQLDSLPYMPYIRSFTGSYVSTGSTVNPIGGNLLLMVYFFHVSWLKNQIETRSKLVQD